MLLAYGIAYSRAPVNMRGLVSAINLFNTAIAYIVNLACSSAVVDPHLIWAFGGPTIVGAVTTVVFVSLSPRRLSIRRVTGRVGLLTAMKLVLHLQAHR